MIYIIGFTIKIINILFYNIIKTYLFFIIHYIHYIIYYYLLISINY